MVSASHWAPEPRAPVPGRGVPTTSDYKNQKGFHSGETEVCWKLRHLLKGPAHRLTDIHFKGSNLKGARNIWGKIELYGLRAKAVGTVAIVPQ